MMVVDIVGKYSLAIIEIMAPCCSPNLKPLATD